MHKTAYRPKPRTEKLHAALDRAAHRQPHTGDAMKTLAQVRADAKQAEATRAAGQIYDLLETPADRANFLMKRALGAPRSLGGLAALNAARAAFVR